MKEDLDISKLAELVKGVLKNPHLRWEQKEDGVLKGTGHLVEYRIEKYYGKSKFYRLEYLPEGSYIFSEIADFICMEDAKDAAQAHYYRNIQTDVDAYIQSTRYSTLQEYAPSDDDNIEINKIWIHELTYISLQDMYNSTNIGFRAKCLKSIHTLAKEVCDKLFSPDAIPPDQNKLNWMDIDENEVELSEPSHYHYGIITITHKEDGQFHVHVHTNGNERIFIRSFEAIGQAKAYVNMYFNLFYGNGPWYNLPGYLSIYSDSDVQFGRATYEGFANQLVRRLVFVDKILHFLQTLLENCCSPNDKSMYVYILQRIVYWEKKRNYWW